MSLSLSFLHGFLVLCLPRLYSALVSLLAETDFPTGADCLSLPVKLQCHPSLPEPGENLPPPHPQPRAQALPCRTACSLIYEGQAGTGPSGRQRSQALRKVWGCPDPVPASREPAREGGTAPLQGQTWVSTQMKQQECTSCLLARKTGREPRSPGTPDRSKDGESAVPATPA
jgi:hypothetical protein